MSYNRVILLGNLGKDPDIRSTPDGRSVCSFSLATTERWTDKSGERKEVTQWNQIVAWGNLASLCGQFLRKGSQALVEGKLTHRQYTDKQGATKTVTEVIAENVRFMNGGNSKQQQQQQQRPESEDDVGF